MGGLQVAATPSVTRWGKRDLVAAEPRKKTRRS
jgi:hypothetical protein